MPTPPARKTVLSEVLTSLAAETTDPLASCVFRYGPQHSWTQGTSETGLVIARWGPGQSESSAGSGNNWWRNSSIILEGYIPDDFADPTASEEARLDLADQLESWVHEHRTLLGNEKVLHVAEMDLPEGTLPADDETVYRMVVMRLATRSLRS